MMRHAVETCPDDLDVLRSRLDELSPDGSRILAVMWQPGGEDQAAAVQGRGRFVIVSRREGSGHGDEVSLDVEPLHDGP
jgi:hypothetical protein